MPRPTVSTATATEIAEAILHKESKHLPPAACPTCEQEFIPVRRWQVFCSSKCRTKANNAAVKQEMNKALSGLLEENRRLTARVKELEDEIASRK